MSTEEELAKRTRLSVFSKRYGYSDLEAMVTDFDREKEAVLARIKLWKENQNLNSGMNTNKTSSRISNKNNQSADAVNIDHK